MKTYILFFLLVSGRFITNAQSQSNTNRIYLGVERSVSPGSVSGSLAAAKYELTYARLLGSGKVSIEGTLGYIDHYKKEQLAPFGYTYLSNRSQRLSLDVALLISVVNTSRHHIRFGLGPSVWYERNGFARDESIFLDSGGTKVTAVTFSVANSYKSVLGSNLTSSYDFVVNPSFMIGLKGSLTGSLLSSKTETGTLNSSMIMAGIRVGYLF